MSTMLSSTVDCNAQNKEKYLKQQINEQKKHYYPREIKYNMNIFMHNLFTYARFIRRINGEKPVVFFLLIAMLLASVLSDSGSSIDH